MKKLDFVFQKKEYILTAPMYDFSGIDNQLQTEYLALVNTWIRGQDLGSLVEWELLQGSIL